MHLQNDDEKEDFSIHVDEDITTYVDRGKPPELFDNTGYSGMNGCPPRRRLLPSFARLKRYRMVMLIASIMMITPVFILFAFFTHTLNPALFSFLVIGLGITAICAFFTYAGLEFYVAQRSRRQAMRQGRWSQTRQKGLLYYLTSTPYGRVLLPALLMITPMLGGFIAGIVTMKLPFFIISFIGLVLFTLKDAYQTYLNRNKVASYYRYPQYDCPRLYHGATCINLLIVSITYAACISWGLHLTGWAVLPPSLLLAVKIAILCKIGLTLVSTVVIAHENHNAPSLYPLAVLDQLTSCFLVDRCAKFTYDYYKKKNEDSSENDEDFSDDESDISINSNTD